MVTERAALFVQTNEVSSNDNFDLSKYRIINLLIYPIVSAIVYSFLKNARREIDSRTINVTVLMIMTKIYRMPRFLGIVMIILTIVFDWCGLLMLGKRFHLQLSDKRYTQIIKWKESKLKIFRDFIKFYESLTFLGFYSRETRVETLKQGN